MAWEEGWKANLLAKYIIYLPWNWAEILSIDLNLKKKEKIELQILPTWAVGRRAVALTLPNLNFEQKNYPDSLHSQGVWNLPYKFHL